MLGDAMEEDERRERAALQLDILREQVLIYRGAWDGVALRQLRRLARRAAECRTVPVAVPAALHGGEKSARAALAAEALRGPPACAWDDHHDGVRTALAAERRRRAAERSAAKWKQLAAHDAGAAAAAAGGGAEQRARDAFQQDVLVFIGCRSFLECEALGNLALVAESAVRWRDMLEREARERRGHVQESMRHFALLSPNLGGSWAACLRQFTSEHNRRQSEITRALHTRPQTAPGRRSAEPTAAADAAAVRRPQTAQTRDSRRGSQQAGLEQSAAPAPGWFSLSPRRPSTPPQSPGTLGGVFVSARAPPPLRAQPPAPRRKYRSVYEKNRVTKAVRALAADAKTERRRALGQQSCYTSFLLSQPPPPRAQRATTAARGWRPPPRVGGSQAWPPLWFGPAGLGAGRGERVSVPV